MPRPLLALLLAATGAVVVAACADEQPNEAIVEEGPLPSDLVTTTAPTTVPPNDIGPPTIDVSTSVSTVGIGAVTFGMTTADAEVAAGSHFSRVDPSQPDACFGVAMSEGPDGLTFTIEDGTVERLDVAVAGITTRSGAGVGSTVEELRALFGDRLRVTEESDGSAVVSFVPTDPEDANYRIIFEADDGVVVSYRAGRLPVVRDGC